MAEIDLDNYDSQAEDEQQLPLKKSKKSVITTGLLINKQRCSLKLENTRCFSKIYGLSTL